MEFLKDLFENRKFMRRLLLFWWMWLFTYATFTVEFDGTTYSILAGISGLMISYYFYTRSQ